MLLVRESRELLLCHPSVPAGFTPAGLDAATGCHGAARPRSPLPANLLAAMPVFGPPSTIVIGTPVYTQPVPVHVRPLPVYQPPPPAYARTAYLRPTRWDRDGDGVPNRRDRLYNPAWDRDGDGIPNRHDRQPDRGRPGR